MCVERLALEVVAGILDDEADVERPGEIYGQLDQGHVGHVDGV